MKKRTARPSKEKTPKPRLVSKAHRLERDENQSAFNAVQRLIERTESAATQRKT